MGFAALFVWATCLHLFIYYVSRYLKENHLLPGYCDFFSTLPIKVDFLNIRFSTSMFNKTANNQLLQRGHYFKKFYGFGAVITMLMLIPSLILLINAAIVSFKNITQLHEEESVLQPVIPGVNLPSSDVFYYLITLLVCTVFHELGHALAAVSEQVPLLSVGFIVWLIIPAAFVELPTNVVNNLSLWKQLKIYCAGVWHNVLLSTFALCLLNLLPIFLVPFFQTGVGVYVTHLNEYESGGQHDFQIGDQVIQINECSVVNAETWSQCLTATLQEPHPGFCVDHKHLSGVQTNGCCNSNDLANSHLCFTSSKLGLNAHYCLQAREVSKQSSAWCHIDQDCPPNHSCLIPSFHQDSVNQSNLTRLILIKRKVADSILYVGLPQEIYASIHVSDYIPKTFLGPQFINSIKRLLTYIFSFSAGLAMLNIVPCYMLDGQHVAGVLAEYIFGSHTVSTRRRRVFIEQAVIYTGTFLVIINIVLGVFELLF